MSILNIYKKLGQTPFEALNELRESNSEFKDSKMVYAGRLDPMAEGVLIVLTDEDRFKLDGYLGFEKIYQATFLFGAETDTYDTLGLVKNIRNNLIADKQIITEHLKNLIGVHMLPFPAYSSYKVKGQPLHMWAREGRLHEIEIPIKEMEVLAVSDVNISTKNAEELMAQIEQNILKVTGNFRQKVIVQKWREVLQNDEQFLVASLTLHVTSGTYIRSLAHEIGQKLGSGAVLLELKRTQVLVN